VLAVLAALALWAAPGHAALDQQVRSDILAARADFQAQAGVPEAFTWSSVFAPGTHTPGNYSPKLNLAAFSFTASDGRTHSGVSAHGLSLASRLATGSTAAASTCPTAVPQPTWP